MSKRTRKFRSPNRPPQRPYAQLQKWCQDNPYIIRWLAKILALSASDIQWGLELRLENGYPWPVTGGKDDWLKLYTRWQQVLEPVWKMIFHNDSKALQKFCEFWSELTAPSRIPASVIMEQWNSLTPAQRQFHVNGALVRCRDMDVRLDRLIAKIEADEPPPPAIVKMCSGLALQFFLRVAAPCWCLYHKRPSQLLRAARTGDRDALDKLVRLDPSIIYDQKISERMHSAAHRSPYDYRKTIQPVLNEPFARPDAWQIKADQGGLLTAVAKLLKIPLTKASVRKLYDAVAWDRTEDMRDESLPLDDEVFRKRLTRNQQKWTSTLRRPKPTST